MLIQNETGIFIVVIIFSLLNVYFIADYLREITKALRELTQAIKDEGLKQNVQLINIYSAIENRKREDKEVK